MQKRIDNKQILNIDTPHLRIYHREGLVTTFIDL